MAEQLKEWSTAYVNDLPDSAFLYIAPGGEKDDEGKTVPRSLRKLPYKNAEGEIDLPHLRNAIARLAQAKTDIPDSTKKKLLAKARKLLEEETEEGMSAIDIGEQSKQEENKMSETQDNEQLYRDVNPKKQMEAKKKAEEEDEVKPSTEEVGEKDNDTKDDKKEESKSETEEEPDKKEKKSSKKTKPSKKKLFGKKKKKKEQLEDGDDNTEDEGNDNDEEESEPEEKAEDSDKKEELEKEIRNTETELNFLKEAKEQLISLYANNKELKDKIEKLEHENSELKSEKEKLNADLEVFKEAKEQLEQKLNRDRLEKLSEKFSILGQDKTVEELSSMDDGLLDEFEKIVDSAIEKLSEDSVAPSVVKQPAESSEPEKDEEKKEEPEKTEDGDEKLSDEDFFRNIAKKMSGSNKRVLEL